MYRGVWRSSSAACQFIDRVCLSVYHYGRCHKDPPGIRKSERRVAVISDQSSEGRVAVTLTTIRRQVKSGKLYPRDCEVSTDDLQLVLFRIIYLTISKHTRTINHLTNELYDIPTGPLQHNRTPITHPHRSLPILQCRVDETATSSDDR